MPKTVRIVVEIQMNDEGDVKSAHRPMSPEDKAEMDSWPSGGLVHVAHAMLIETLRREAYLMAISQLSTGSAPDGLTSKGVGDLTRAHIAEMVDRFVGHAADEAVKIIQD